MDIISQLQEQVNLIAHLAFNTIGTLQRDAPPNRLSPNYPEPPPHPTEDGSNFSEQPKLMSAGLVKAAKQVCSILAKVKKEMSAICSMSCTFVQRELDD
ncbi:Mediator of RNA polymerase II transcription subunit 21 [Stylosanthes scabra]|uniref:Mediator of RNA polymerase II transcription subunit 21 n=1 Tax=Stylosanthes scabra TaxID=79078 RepID=A0ABU6XHB4_9FABA|nr:Mediator of RNA polymerase II transcription subunit 21 [Stylosanthes scabra]